MKTSLALGILSLATLLHSCKKEDTSSSDKVIVKTYREEYKTPSDHYSSEFTLSHDSHGRLLNMVSTASAGDRFQLFYDNGTITMDIYSGDQLSLHEVFFLRDDEYIDSTVQYNDANNFSSERIFYTSSNQLQKLISYDYFGPTPEISNVTNYTYDANGNVIKEKDRYSETTYEYFTELNSGPDLGLPDFAKNRHLVKTTTTSNGYAPQVWNHTYSFDGKKRITQEQVISNSGDTLTRSYSY